MEDSFRDTYRQYLKDESRTVGYADSISFPKTEEEVSEDLKTHCGKGIPVTVQGARTGLTGGCVPFGGHILNTSGLDRFLGMEMAEDGSFLIRVQPAVPLSRLRSLLAEKSLPTEGLSEESLAVYEQFRPGRHRCLQRFRLQKLSLRPHAALCHGTPPGPHRR